MRSRVLTALLLASVLCPAAVKSIQVIDRSDVLDGESEGAAGRYERIIAKAHFAVDPNLAANKIIADIDLAPRDEKGMVEFSADLYILKPRDAAKGNGTALVEISNRGGKGLLGTFDDGAFAADPKAPQEFGDRFLLKQGFTLVWIGWEPDVPNTPGMLRLDAPVATEHGKTIVGTVRSEYIGEKPVHTISLADMNQIAYALADPNAPGTQLTVRDRIRAERQVIPRNEWKFEDERHVTLKSGFEPGRVYEVIYQAKDPVLVGLGPTAVRDMVSYLKYSGEEKGIQRAIGFGISQSGRFLREFLYDGFNADEKGRRVFDGVWAHVAGAGRGSFNFRFAQPSRDGNPFRNTIYPTDIPPFTEDGLLEQARKQNVEPKIFFTNGSYEYWGRAASLIHTTPDGKADVTPDANTRIYFFAGSQHGAGSIPPRKVEAQNLSSVNDYRFAERALLLKMQAWLKDGIEPPPSEYPKVSKDQLVSVGALAFPQIDGVRVPRIKREAYRLDFATEPPKVGDPYPSLVPQVNSDGNETAGIRMPEVAVPLGTHTGWNLRSKAIGAPDEMLNFTGSYIPFSRTTVERENRKDPRPSIEERYKSKREYLEKITDSAQQLVQKGFLLDSDVPRIRGRAASEWDYVQTAN
jgi:hypothetical protein